MLVQRCYTGATVMPAAELGALVSNLSLEDVAFTVRRARTTDTRRARTAKLSTYSKFWQGSPVRQRGALRSTSTEVRNLTATPFSVAGL